MVVCCFVASQKHTDSLCFGAGWPAGWLQGCKRVQAAGKSEKNCFSWISERKLGIFGCFLVHFSAMRWFFAVSDASHKHTVC